MPTMIPPIGQCCICHKPIGVHHDYARVTVETHRLKGEQAPGLTILACGSDHAADGMRRLAQVIEQKVRHAPGSPEWAQKHGIATVRLDSMGPIVV